MNTEILTPEQIQEYKDSLLKIHLDEQQEARAREFIDVLEECEGDLTSTGIVMAMRAGAELIRWSSKPVSISLDDFCLWAKGLKKIAVYYDTPNNDLMGEF